MAGESGLVYLSGTDGDTLSFAAFQGTRLAPPVVVQHQAWPLFALLGAKRDTLVFSMAGSTDKRDGLFVYEKLPWAGASPSPDGGGGTSDGGGASDAGGAADAGTPDAAPVGGDR